MKRSHYYLILLLFTTSWLQAQKLELFSSGGGFLSGTGESSYSIGEPFIADLQLVDGTSQSNAGFQQDFFLPFKINYLTITPSRYYKNIDNLIFDSIKFDIGVHKLDSTKYLLKGVVVKDSLTVNDLANGKDSILVVAFSKGKVDSAFVEFEVLDVPDCQVYIDSVKNQFDKNYYTCKDTMYTFSTIHGSFEWKGMNDSVLSFMSTIGLEIDQSYYLKYTTPKGCLYGPLTFEDTMTVVYPTEAVFASENIQIVVSATNAKPTVVAEFIKFTQEVRITQKPTGGRVSITDEDFYMVYQDTLGVEHKDTIKFELDYGCGTSLKGTVLIDVLEIPLGTQIAVDTVASSETIVTFPYATFIKTLTDEFDRKSIFFINTGTLSKFFHVETERGIIYELDNVKEELRANYTSLGAKNEFLMDVFDVQICDTLFNCDLRKLIIIHDTIDLLDVLSINIEPINVYNYSGQSFFENDFSYEDFVKWKDNTEILIDIKDTLSRNINAGYLFDDVNRSLFLSGSDYPTSDLTNIFLIEICDKYHYQCKEDTLLVYFNAQLRHFTDGDSIFNVISPNGDGENDFFLIEGLDVDDKVTIYSKWGEKVFEGKNYIDQNGYWEGLYNVGSTSGQEAPSGTYYYFIEYHDEEEGVSVESFDYVHHIKNTKVSGFVELRR